MAFGETANGSGDLREQHPTQNVVVAPLVRSGKSPLVNPVSPHLSIGPRSGSHIDAFYPVLIAHTLPAVGQCSANDEAVFVNNQNFSDSVLKFGRDAWGFGSGLIPLLAAANPTMTQSCLKCFGAQIDCGRRHCLIDCALDPYSKKCLGCAEKNCNTDFRKCLGGKARELLAPKKRK
jgi:hypothetical protein